MSISPVSKTIGYTYKNASGMSEGVRLVEDDVEVVGVYDSLGNECRVYVSDIPSMIEALKAMYEHEMGDVI